MHLIKWIHNDMAWWVRPLHSDGSFFAEYDKRSEPQSSGGVEGKISVDDYARIAALILKIKVCSNEPQTTTDHDWKGFIVEGNTSNGKFLFRYYEHRPSVADEMFAEIVEIMSRYLSKD